MRTIAKFLLITLFSIVGIGQLNRINAAPEEPPCITVAIVCPDGHLAGYAVICNMEDLYTWTEILCEENPN